MKNPIAKYLMCAYAYYELDKPLISDTEFDLLAKDILNNWDNIEHMHKYLLTKDMLEGRDEFCVNYLSAFREKRI